MAEQPIGQQIGSLLNKAKDIFDVAEVKGKAAPPQKTPASKTSSKERNDRDNRIVYDYAALGRLADALRELKQRVVVTLGTFDMIHVGHSRYLERAKALGDTLIVGVDSDRAVKSYKGPDRPMVPQNERLEMLLHTRYVDWVTLIDDVDDQGNWQYELLKVVKPDTFVAVEDSYSDRQLRDIKRFSKTVVVLPRQAATSTSETIRRTLLAQAKPVSDQLRVLADKIETGQL